MIPPAPEPVLHRAKREKPTLVNDIIAPFHPLASEQVSIPTAASLSSLLGAADPEAPLEERFEWLAELGRWLHDPPLRPEIWRGPAQPPNTGRLRFLVRVMRVYPTWRAVIGGVLHNTLEQLSALRFFAHAGLPAESSFFGEATSRLARRMALLPHHYRDLAELVELIFPGEPDVAWLSEIPMPLLSELMALLHPYLRVDGEGRSRMRDDLCDALLLLGVRASALGLAEDVRAQVADPLRESPFTGLPRKCGALADAVHQEPRDKAAISAKASLCREQIGTCRRVVEEIRGRLVGASISLDLVYRLGLAEQLLERMEQLLDLLVPDGRPPTTPLARLLSSVLRGQARTRTLRGILGTSLRQVGERVAECAGKYGEKYIGRSADDHHGIVSSAAGGGLLTAFTVLVKFILGWASLPLFFEGLFVAANYAGSFLAMQLCGFSLATKQTSVMAASLARTLRTAESPGDVVDAAVSIIRSLWAAVLGNVGAVIPSAVALNVLWWLGTGENLLTEERARHVVESLHPWKSGTIAYAALTGVFLWVAGLASGWFENWSSYRRVPETLARRSADGSASLFERLLHRFAGNPAGTAGSVCLGLLMGMGPVVARFFGIPADVRHVTLAMGGLALAGAALGPEALIEPDFLWAVVGIGVIAVMNFGVSFTLSLAFAKRAHGEAPQFPIAKEVWRVLVRSPGELLLPPRTPELDAAGAETEG